VSTVSTTVSTAMTQVEPADGVGEPEHGRGLAVRFPAAQLVQVELGADLGASGEVVQPGHQLLVAHRP
jgi:hypothetical protein